jgi:hypothetical protein
LFWLLFVLTSRKPLQITILKHETTHKEKKRFAVSKVIQNWHPYQLANRQDPKSLLKDNYCCSI